MKGRVSLYLINLHLWHKYSRRVRSQLLNPEAQVGSRRVGSRLLYVETQVDHRRVGSQLLNLETQVG